MSCLIQTEFKSELQVVEGFFDVALMIVQTESDLQGGDCKELSHEFGD